MRSFLLTLCLLSCLGVASQEEKKAAAAAGTPAPAKASVEISDGKAWLIVEGKTTLLREEIVIGTTRVSPDGVVVMKDGKKLRLKNGDKVTEDGSLQSAAEKRVNPDAPVPPDKQP